MNFKHKAIVIITDILIIIELCVSMYFSNKQTPENLTPMFLKSFAAMGIPTLIIAKIAIKKLASPNIPHSENT